MPLTIWLVFFAAMYLLIVVARGIIEFVSWCIEAYFVQPEASRRVEKTSLPQPPRAPSDRHRTENSKPKEAPREPAHIPGQGVRQTRRPSRIGRFLKLLKVKVFIRGYGYWVASALSEDDLAIKVEYLSKALRLNPTYFPAMGMKGYALFELERYGEAMECFDKCLETNPNAVTRYKRALCCCRMKRREEAIGCLNKVINECADQDRQLLDNALRMKTLMEDELRNIDAFGGTAKGGGAQGVHDAPRRLEDAHEESPRRAIVQTNASPLPGIHKGINVIQVM